MAHGGPDGHRRTPAEDLTTAVRGPLGVHHVHAWSISEKRPVATLHAVLDPCHPAGETVAAIKRRLAERHRVAHATVEAEFSDAPGQGKWVQGARG